MSNQAHPADDIIRNDADLVALLRAGDEEAMSQLVNRWSPTMFRVARSFVGSRQSAEDVVQEAWLGMLSGLANFEGRSSLRTWTFTILVNRARTRGAREARTIPQPPSAGHSEHGADDWFASPGGGAGRSWSSIDLTSAAAPGGHHARCLRDVDRRGLRRPGYLTGESAGPAASRPYRPARGPGRVLPWMMPAPGGSQGLAESLRPGEGTHGR